MKKWLSNRWSWLSGKKMAIGGVMLLASKYIDDPLINTVLTLGGELLVGGGLVHKVGKSKLPSGLKAKVNQLKSLAKRK